jgi:hypothetical protein
VFYEEIRNDAAPYSLKSLSVALSSLLSTLCFLLSALYSLFASWHGFSVCVQSEAGSDMDIIYAIGHQVTHSLS